MMKIQFNLTVNNLYAFTTLVSVSENIIDAPGSGKNWSVEFSQLVCKSFVVTSRNIRKLHAVVLKNRILMLRNLGSGTQIIFRYNHRKTYLFCIASLETKTARSRNQLAKAAS